MKKNPQISIQNVDFKYGPESILENISLDIYEGDFVGLIGPNGSGKTTLLKVMLGLLEQSQGRVKLFGKPVKEFTDWNKIGYIAQKAAVTAVSYPISVEEIVGMGKGSKDDISKALQEVGLENQRKKLLKELSGGQQQRVFIARALVSSPELIILDEPTVGVDADSQTKFYALLRKLNEHHKLTVVLVSHDIDVIAHEVKTIACINKKILFYGKPKEALKKNFVERVYGKHVTLINHNH